MVVGALLPASTSGFDYLRWTVDGQSVTMTLGDASKAKATTKGSMIGYRDALPYLDATYNVLGDGLEEVLMLKDGQAPSSFTFLLKGPRRHDGHPAAGRQLGLRHSRPRRPWLLLAQGSLCLRLSDQEREARSAPRSDERQGGQERFST